MVSVVSPYSAGGRKKFQVFVGRNQSTQFTRSNLFSNSSGIATTWLLL
jgi:hypothetical protein